MTIDGEVVISNAGHPPPLVIAGGHHTEVRGDRRADWAVLRVAVFVDAPDARERRHAADVHRRAHGSAEPPRGMEYGTSRLEGVASGVARGSVEDLLQTTIADQVAFRGSSANTDEVTVLALRRM